MAYYDKIASQWHKITGYKGGAFKELILNKKVISLIDDISGKSLLELGAGNGYFMPLLLKKKSGQVPQNICITDVSFKNLEIAQKHFRLKNAKYQRLDVYKLFKLEDDSFDLIVSNMMFNEVKKPGLENGLKECKRVLRDQGQLLISVLHPDFIRKQMERGVVKNNRMNSKNGLKVPVTLTGLADYTELLEDLGMNYELKEIYGNQKLYNMKPKLKEISEIPIALIINARTC